MIEPMVVDKDGNIYYSAKCISELEDKKSKEIERLNNIINELEDYLLCQLVSCPISVHKEYQEMYHKLKELKGDSSND